MPDVRLMASRRYAEGQERRRAFLEHLREHKDVMAACDHVGVTAAAYKKWRARHPEFAVQADVARVGEEAAAARKTKDPGFAEFRHRYFGMESLWFQLQAIEAYETCPPGNIVLLLWPPEHGKTSLFEDYASYKLAVVPHWRFSVGSGGINMSRKILGRVRARMSLGSPFPEYLRDYGPFAPQTRTAPQPWGADYFSVFRKGSFDERDYSMVALGFSSNIAGTRTDHLHVDDPQELKTLSQTESRFDVFRQDWLTRPGESGITTINGTRVGEGDIYQRIEEEYDSDLLRVVRFPAIVYNSVTEQQEPLWPYDETTGKGWTMEMLDRLRRKIGDEAWARNYMQAPLDSQLKTFTDEGIAPALNTLRSLDHPPTAHASCAVAVDPAIAGRNATMLAEFQSEKMVVLDIWEDTTFTHNGQIIGRIRDAVVSGSQSNATVTDVVVETMAFQKGLERDPEMERLADSWGFNVRPHLTGNNKYDENIGIPSLATAVRRGEIELPFAGDDRTQYWVGELIRQMKQWKPHVRGNRVRMDLLMTLWFLWIVWQERGRGDDGQGSEAFRFAGLPFRPTKMGLMTPGGRRV